MSFSKPALLFGALTLLTKVQAHGRVTGVVADGQYYLGYNPAFRYQNPAPVVAGWTADNLDNGFVSDYSSPDIICHKSATPGGAYVKVAAGSAVELQWTDWPVSHHGPVLDFLAPCGDDCTTVDKTGLKFTKIDEAGLNSGSPQGGNWASDDLIANNNTWSVTIPSSIAPGKYVLRHDTIALHAAFDLGGSQAYPQCFNLEITGSGTNSLTTGGVPATEFYNDADPGIHINIYTNLQSYIIPGPPVLGGSGSSPQPSATTTAAAVSSTTTTAAASSSVAATSAAASTTTAKVDITASVIAPTAVISTTIAAITTSAAASSTTTTTKSAVVLPTEAAPSSATLPPYTEEPVATSTSPVSFSSTVTGRIGKPTKFVCYVEE